MKVKVNLDKEVMQQFLLDHVEKIVFGVVAAGCLLVIYGAVARKGFDKTAKGLTESASRAEKHLKKTDPSEDPICKAPDPTFFATVSHTRDSIKDDLLAHQAFFFPVVAAEGKRDRPSYHPVAELQAIADRGALKKRRNSPISGERWVMLWGVVPIQSQRESFRKAFENAKYASKSVPKYLQPIIERAEVTGTGDEPKWEEIDLVKAKEKVDLLANPPAEMIDSSLTPPELAWPLPPRNDNRPWGDGIYPRSLVGPAYRDVKQDPGQFKGEKVTWLVGPGTLARKCVIYERKIDPGAVVQARDYFAVEYPDDDTAAQRLNQTMINAVVEGSIMATVRNSQNQPVRRAIPLLKSLEKKPNTDSAPVEGDAAADDPPATRTPETPETAVVSGPENLLFRFIDYGVEPGKSYRYRVALNLANPNYNIESRYLVKPEDAKDKRVTTDYVAMSDVVSVPHDIRLLAKGAKMYVGEPWGEMMVVRWVGASGLDAHKDFLAVRGFTPYFAGKEAANVLGAEPDAADVNAEIEYRTDSLVLDVRGGERLPGKYKVTPPDPKNKDTEKPAEILILNAQGQLDVCDELNDAAEIEYRLNPNSGTIVHPTTRPANRGGAGTGGGGGGGLDGDEFK